MNADCWQIIGTLATVGIFIVAWVQLNLMRQESKRERTLNLCTLYDIDPVLSEIVKKFRTSLESLDEHDKLTMLNYFDVMAIGVAQNSYDPNIIYPQFKNIIPKMANDLGIQEYKEQYPDLLGFIKKIEENVRKQNAV